MNNIHEKFEETVAILQCIHAELKSFLKKSVPAENSSQATVSMVYVSFKGPEVYLLHKAFVDSGGAPSETYKSLLEKTAPHLANKNQKGFSVESLQKNSDKVDYEAKENVKRFLQKMIRNIDSY